MSLSSRTRAEMAVSHGILHRKSPDQIIDMLFDDGLLTPDPTIIRTVEELEALDPETLLYCGWRECHYILAKDLHPDHLPAMVLVPAAQVRAAYKALEEA